jgi:uncharacterized membrane protein HdeD (DUF308 family)
MSRLELVTRRTGWDIIFGALLVIAGLLLLGDTAFATNVSVLFVGWMVLLAGIVGLIAALFRIGRGGFWSAAITGGLLTVLGIAILRNTHATALTLTLIAGAMFLAGGIVRLVAAGQEPDHRVPLVLTGLVGTVLGLLVLFNLVDASYTFLGLLLGIQVLVDGVVMILIGRAHLTVVEEATV